MNHRLAFLAALVGVVALSSASADAQGRRGRRIDADGDGKISLQEFIASRGAIFERLDLNHDGQITKDELATFQSRMDKAEAGAEIRSGKPRGEGEGPARQIGRLMELSANGVITRAQWDAAMTKRFERLDTGHTGYITLDQMRPRRQGEAAAPPATMSPPTPAPTPQ
jgi:Ca2+-binding EF-hand superfamily protein